MVNSHPSLQSACLGETVIYEQTAIIYYGNRMEIFKTEKTYLED
jgi:hypothetical protein